MSNIKRAVITLAVISFFVFISGILLTINKEEGPRLFHLIVGSLAVIVSAIVIGLTYVYKQTIGARILAILAFIFILNGELGGNFATAVIDDGLSMALKHLSGIASFVITIGMLFAIEDKK